MNKLGIKIEFTSVFSPWSNGINERNYYSCDVILRKAMEEDEKLKLQTAMNMARAGIIWKQFIPADWSVFTG